MCTATPSPARFFDWIVSIAPINFLPGDQKLVDYFETVKAEIAERVGQRRRLGADEKYRLFFDGIMNWNKIGWLADKFAALRRLPSSPAATRTWRSGRSRS